MFFCNCTFQSIAEICYLIIILLQHQFLCKNILVCFASIIFMIFWINQFSRFFTLIHNHPCIVLNNFFGVCFMLFSVFNSKFIHYSPFSPLKVDYIWWQTILMHKLRIHSLVWVNEQTLMGNECLLKRGRILINNGSHFVWDQLRMDNINGSYATSAPGYFFCVSYCTRMMRKILTNMGFLNRLKNLCACTIHFLLHFLTHSE